MFTLITLFKGKEGGSIKDRLQLLLVSFLFDCCYILPRIKI
jgi:hypothetical protein